jgi:heat shock protein HslJ
MEKLFFIPCLFAMLLLANGCKSQNSIPYATGDTSATSLDWEGQYQSTLPCADCEGIATTIFLFKDAKYIKTTRYLGKSGEELVEKGTFKWDKTGSHIFLSNTESGPNQYLVGENQLFQLDIDGNRITGDLADSYRFRKMDIPENISLYGKKWTVIQIGIIKGASLEKHSLNLSLDPTSRRINGFSGCNYLNGTYQTGEENQLLFSKIATTRKFCESIGELENAFLKALEKVRSYQMSDHQLELFDENNTSLLVLKDNSEE